jgi:glycosyltransferase involved in cell wall biosynthesis
MKMLAYFALELANKGKGRNLMRIAFVIQRYGKDIIGGSESLCRQIAERMKSKADVEILTTCAEDYITWNNAFKQGLEELNGITIRRFDVHYPREIESFNHLSNEVLLKPQPFEKQVDWVMKQGPVSPDLISYIKTHKDQYDAFIFFTYLYYPTYLGLQIVPEKSIFVPTAHNEAAIYLDIYKALFFMPRGIAFNTDEERNFVHNTFKNGYIPWEITGTGIDLPDNIDTAPFKRKYDLKRPYILNMGRIEEGKGSKELFDYFCRFKEKNRIALDLVFMGQLLIDIGKRDDVKFLGYIPEAEKNMVIAGALSVMVPSPYESLALALLESWGCRTPTISSAKCEVTKAHAKKGMGGLVYSDYEEFEHSLNRIASDEKYRFKLGKAGYYYVKSLYSWDKVVDKYMKLISSFIQKR